MKKRVSKRIIAIAATAAMIAASLVLTGCGGNPTVARVTVNGTNFNVTADDVRVYVPQAEHALMMEYFNEFPGDAFVDYEREFEDGRTFARMIREEAARTAAIQVFFGQTARDMGISLSREDRDMVNQQIEMIRMQLNTPDNPRGFVEELELAGFRNERHLANYFDAQQLIGHVLEAIVDNPEELARFTEGAEAEEGSANERASAILERINAGEDFVELMNTYSEDPGLASFPDGYTFGPFEMVPEFEQATRELAIGEVSGLVRTTHGYHIVMRIEPDITQMMRPPAEDGDEELFGAMHILIQDAGGSERDAMMHTVFDAFQQKVEDAEFEFLGALDNIPVPLIPVDPPPDVDLPPVPDLEEDEDDDDEDENGNGDDEDEDEDEEDDEDDE